MRERRSVVVGSVEMGSVWFDGGVLEGGVFIVECRDEEALVWESRRGR